MMRCFSQANSRPTHEDMVHNSLYVEMHVMYSRLQGTVNILWEMRDWMAYGPKKDLEKG